ncbi:MAG: type I-E CRISPR-associated protein Cse1/CasA [Chitinispirillaceae bacterium]|nr:type I-E CRISPR-associated protein Cse1/CasA [Chitinispirillaceae bacterium]
MNLVTEPWIPVVTTVGKPDFANLMQVFTEGDKFADLSVRPHERVALMRLLICIAQAALDGPSDKEDWKEAPKKMSEAARKYLTVWNNKEVFELFHPKKPFLQIADLESNGLTPLNYMEFAPTLNGNPTLNTYFADGNKNRSFLDAQIALMLPTFLCFSTGGGLPITTWGIKKTKQVGSENHDALCVTGSMYHLFIRSQNLFETVAINLLPKTVVERHYRRGGDDEYWGKPVWELFPIGSNDVKAIQNAIHSYLGRLMPLCRWVKIDRKGNGMHCGNGFVYPTMERKIGKAKQNQVLSQPWPAEPTAAVGLNSKKTERILLGIKPGEPDKAVWRELAALMIRRNENSIGGPLALQNPLPRSKYDILVCALHRKSGQQAVENLFESVYSISDKLMNENGRVLYEKGITDAEWQSYSLGNAIETYRQNLDSYWEQRKKAASKPAILKKLLHSKATRSYWTAIEKQRQLLMSIVDAWGNTELFDATQKVWRTAIHKSAREAYISACGQETSRQIRAFALGWKKLIMEEKNKTEIEEQNNDGGEEL